MFTVLFMKNPNKHSGFTFLGKDHNRSSDAICGNKPKSGNKSSNMMKYGNIVHAIGLAQWPYHLSGCRRHGYTPEDTVLYIIGVLV